MNGIFSLDSDLTKVLNRVFDMFALNVLFLICCIPLFTIGAAQAGLMNAVRVMRDKQSDGSVYKAFFRELTIGFSRITVIWTVLLLLIAALLYILFGVVYLEAAWERGAVAAASVGLVVCMLLQSAVMAFHSRFACTIPQLIRNAWLMILTNLPRTLLMTALIWAPVMVSLLNLSLFVQATPGWLLIYYSAAFYLCTMLIQKPFRAIEDHFLSSEASVSNAECSQT